MKTEMYTHANVQPIYTYIYGFFCTDLTLGYTLFMQECVHKHTHTNTTDIFFISCKAFHYPVTDKTISSLVETYLLQLKL